LSTLASLAIKASVKPVKISFKYSQADFSKLLHLLFLWQLLIYLPILWTIPQILASIVDKFIAVSPNLMFISSPPGILYLKRSKPYFILELPIAPSISLRFLCFCLTHFSSAFDC